MASCSSVDLPAPFGPSSPVTPGGIRTVSLFRPITLPYHLETPSNSTTGVTSGGPAISHACSKSIVKVPTGRPGRRPTISTDTAVQVDRRSGDELIGSIAAPGRLLPKNGLRAARGTSMARPISTQAASVFSSASPKRWRLAV